MTEAVLAAERATPHTSTSADRRLRRRYAAERRFQVYGVLAIAVAVGALALLLVSVVARGYGAFYQHVISLEVDLSPDVLGVDEQSDPDALRRANYPAVVKRSLYQLFPEVEGRRDRRELTALISSGAAFQLAEMVREDPGLVGTRRTVSVPLSDEADLFFKGDVSREVAEADRRLSDQQIAWLDALGAEGRVRAIFNWSFLSSGDSREPELAGIWGAVVGSVLTLAVTLTLCFPIGVASAVYLEEYAPKNRWTDLIEVNINNLAAVPSIVFGLLGLAVFLDFFGLPRSAPLVGGLVLALMTLPTIIIAARAALKAVPPSIREAAFAVGASPVQTVLHHVLPLALPGILTGTIIGMARALGETAPLLMIGMVAFIVDIPSGITSPATALPVQIFLWADSPERAFVEKTSAAIMVLLAFLIGMNLLAVILRKRFERRW
jgi:phosphate transport system permease protein